jgi:hypothetical protein
MKTKKLIKKLENNILKKKIKNLTFFSLGYCSNAKSFFKKNKRFSKLLNADVLKHPLKVKAFSTLNDLKSYILDKSNKVVYVQIGKIYIKQNTPGNFYSRNDVIIKSIFVFLKKIFFFWRLVLV